VRTFIEKNLDSFGKCSNLSADELVKKGLEALRETLPSEQELSSKNVSIAIVGENHKFTVYDNDDTKKWLDQLDSLKKASRTTASQQSSSTAANNNVEAAATEEEAAPAEMQE